ncbi:MAG TPA: alpha-galactosidase [Bryobacteraceae bacterium]
MSFGSRLAGAVETASFETCRASWDGTRLTLANSHIERQWVWQKDRLHPISFRDLDSGVEWLAPVPAAARETAKLRFTSRAGSATPVQAPSLTVDLESSPSVSYHFQIFPQARGILLQASPNTLAEMLMLAPEHIRLTQVTLLDQTDVHNQLVFENEWLPQRNEKALQLEGDLFIAEDTLTHSGLVFLKLAPLPHARPIKEPWDLEAAMHGRNLQCTLANGSDYPYVVLSYAGGQAGRTEALQTFQRQIRPYVPSRDGMFLSNTWGDRSRDARINSDFMRREIEAGSKLGVDVIQIDDGWQTGRTINSARGPGVWNGYWAENPNFWQPDPVRFPGGLKPLVQQAARKGMKFGLWYSPDSSNSFGNWQRDAGRLLELHHNEGIDYFKIDGVKAVTKEGEQNLRRMFDRVQQETHGVVVFDLDVTAETRPGYFGMSDVGPLFVENRYTDFHGYWPHQTLRNLWQLAAYVDPLRLRMEVLNNERNRNLYELDALAPAKYTPDMLFATVMFANPLGWFETSNLAPSYTAAMSKLVATWKQQRSQLFSDTILPIGEAPDGTNWSGFAAFNAAHTSGYLLLFRGVGAPAEWSAGLNVFRVATPRAEILGGEGTVTLNGGHISARIPQSPGFVWVRVQ